MPVFVQVQLACERDFLTHIAAWSVFFVVVHVFAKSMGSASALLKSRPTVVAGTIHGLSTSWLATAIYFGFLDISWWHTVGFPLSAAYLITDIFFYCVPKKDVSIFVHHVVMVWAHFCVGTEAAAALGGAGNALWARELSVAGYLSELPNPLLNTRWIMMKKFTKNHPIFALNNILLVALWTWSRLVLIPILVFTRIFPRKAEFLALDANDAFVGCVAAHGLIFLMSAYWLLQLGRGGVYSLLVFNPDSKGYNPNARDNVKCD